VARWVGGEREGPYPRGGVGYLWLARSFRWAAHALFEPLLEAEVENKLSARELFRFCAKMGPFWGGMPPVVAPEGNLGFGRKPSCPFY
jgi:hypothetical protein